MKKVKEYHRKTGQAIKRRKSQRETDQLKATDEPLKTKTPLPEYQLFPPQLNWNLFWPPQPLIYKDSVPPNNILWNVSFHKPSQGGLTKQMQPFKHLELAVGQQPLPTPQHKNVAVY